MVECRTARNARTGRPKRAGSAGGRCRIGQIAAALAAVVIALSGCAGGAPDVELALPPPWHHGETTVLELSQGDEVVGTITMEAAAAEGGWTLSSVTEAGSHIETAVITTGPDLQPLAADISMEDSGSFIASVRAVYGAEELSIEAETPEGPQDASVKLPEQPFYDNDQFLWFLRALPLEDDFMAEANLVVSRTASKAPIIVKADGRETVPTPAGEIEAWKVELVGLKQFGWVEVASPHRIVKFENEAAGTVSLLKEYSPEG